MTGLRTTGEQHYGLLSIQCGEIKQPFFCNFRFFCIVIVVQARCLLMPTENREKKWEDFGQKRPEIPKFDRAIVKRQFT